MNAIFSVLPFAHPFRAFVTHAPPWMHPTEIKLFRDGKYPTYTLAFRGVAYSNTAETRATGLRTAILNYPQGCHAKTAEYNRVGSDIVELKVDLLNDEPDSAPLQSSLALLPPAPIHIEVEDKGETEVEETKPILEGIQQMVSY